MRAHKLSEERENKRLLEMQRYAQVENRRTTDPEERWQLDERIERLGAQRVAVVASIYSDRALTPCR